MLDNRTLTFLTVCKEMNYTRAAEKLHITQPAVSQHIQYIEDYYGKELIAVKHLELFEDGDLIILSPKVIKNYAKGKYSGIPCDVNGNPLENQED